MHEWFVEMFPETGAWFSARLRYTRSSAVMSMVGYVLGYEFSPNATFISADHRCSRLGDRHGENILFEEGSGGVLHVDFNCLFDKVGKLMETTCVHVSNVRTGSILRETGIGSVSTYA